jgi:hypothetical protein
MLRSNPGSPSVVTRSTHASHPGKSRSTYTSIGLHYPATRVCFAQALCDRPRVFFTPRGTNFVPFLVRDTALDAYHYSFAFKEHTTC